MWRLFVLTAGHCQQPQFSKVYRSTEVAPKLSSSGLTELGEVARTGYGYPEPITMDAEAIEVNSPEVIPQGIWGEGGNLVPTEPAATAKVNSTLCFSGTSTQIVSCGEVTEISRRWVASDSFARAGYWVKFRIPATFGDSGGPVWNIFGASVGLVSAMGKAGEPHGPDETFVEPLLTPPGLDPDRAYGVLSDPHLGNLSLKIADDGS